MVKPHSSVTRKRNIEAKRSQSYAKVIQINVPVRYYWNKKGSYDGMEVGPFKGKVTSHELRLLNKVLRVERRKM